MTQLMALLFQQDASQTGSAAAAGMGMGIAVVYFAVLILMVGAFWKVFVKAGEPGWAAIVPIYNLITLLKIAGKPAWWFLLMLIPLVNIIILIIVAIAVAKNFGKETGFGIGLAILPFIFYPMLAWGDATYHPVAP